MPIPALSDQGFLVSFAIAAVFAAMAAQVWRILALNHSDVRPTGSLTSTPPSLDPIEAALVAGGERLAFTVAKAALCSAGVLDDDERLVRPPGDGDGLGPVSRAIAAASMTSGPLTWQRCAAVAAVQGSLTALAADLQARGLLLTPGRRLLLALSGAPLAALDLVGAGRLAGHPDPSLAVAVGFVALICAGLLATVPHGTRLGLSLTTATEPRDEAAAAASARPGCDDGQPVPR